MSSSGKKTVVGLVVGLTTEDTTACNEILDRLKQISNVKSDTALAKVLGLKQSSISTAKTRGMVPSSWIVNASSLFNISADWLIYGDKKISEKAPEKTLPATPPAAQADTKIKHDYSKISEEGALDLSPDEFKALWDHYWAEKEWRGGWLQAEITKRFPEFITWLEQRQAPLTPAHIAALKKGGQLTRFSPPDQPDDD